MIRPNKRDADTMLTLPRNEAAFSALMSTLSEHLTECEQDLNKAALLLVKDEAMRPRAQMLMGQVYAIKDVINLLERLIVGGNDGNR